jgi:hypothetical protein
MIQNHDALYTEAEVKILRVGMARLELFTNGTAKVKKAKSLTPTVKNEIAFKEGDPLGWGRSETLVRAPKEEVRCAKILSQRASGHIAEGPTSEYKNWRRLQRAGGSRTARAKTSWRRLQQAGGGRTARANKRLRRLPTSWRRASCERENELAATITSWRRPSCERKKELAATITSWR